MDTALSVAVITAVGGIAVAVIAWHAQTVNARINQRNAAEEAARRIREEANRDLDAARQATEEERQRLLELLHRRVDEALNQLGSTRQSLARTRKENVALRAENEELRRALGHDDAEQGGVT